MIQRNVSALLSLLIPMTPNADPEYSVMEVLFIQLQTATEESKQTWLDGLLACRRCVHLVRQGDRLVSMFQSNMDLYFGYRDVRSRVLLLA